MGSGYIDFTVENGGICIRDNAFQMWVEQERNQKRLIATLFNWIWLRFRDITSIRLTYRLVAKFLIEFSPKIRLNVSCTCRVRDMYCMW